MRHALPASFCLAIFCSAATGESQAPTVPSSACVEQAPDGFLKWGASSAIRLTTVSPGGSVDDLQRVKRLVGQARIVGIGEAARRVREFYQLRHRLLEFLVEEMGFTAFAMETGFAEATKLNDYVLGRIPEPDDWQQWFTFGYGDEEELQALIHWMRTYNADARHKRKLRFYGIDVMVPYSSPITALEYSFSYLEKVDPAFAASATRRQLISAVEPFLGSGGSRANMEVSIRKYLALPAAARDTYTAAVADLVARFEAHRAAYVSGSSEEAFQWNYQTAKAARQLDTTYRAAAAATPPGAKLDLPVAIWSTRDAAMLENLLWALDREGPDGRIVVWAHNAHISKGSLRTERADVVGLWESGPRLGAHLDQMFGSRYLAIGTSFNEGRQIGFARINREPAACGTLDRELARLSLPLFLLQLSAAAPSSPERAWLSQPRLMQADNATVDYRLTPREAWDAVLFVRNVSAVRITSRTSK